VSPDCSVSQLVDGALLLDELSACFRRHLSLPEGAADAMALWVVFTWCLDLFQHSPRLAFQSPVYGCGKTTAFEILKELVPNPLATSNITPPLCTDSYRRSLARFLLTNWILRTPVRKVSFSTFLILVTIERLRPFVGATVRILSRGNTRHGRLPL
jgi:hypothetical protein